MDKYTFTCPSPGHGRFEVEQKMMEPHIADCPICNQPAERIWTPVPHVWEPYANPNHPERRGVEG